MCLANLEIELDILLPLDKFYFVSIQPILFLIFKTRISYIYQPYFDV